MVAARLRPNQSTSVTQTTPRNLFGFKDGTSNLKAEDPALLDEHVWVPPRGRAADWMVGGTYLVARRIRMHVEVWDRTSLVEQETLIGRRKGSRRAAGRGGRVRRARPGRDQRRTATPAIDPVAHIRLASPERSTASGSCAAATTSPTAPTASATSTPACSSSRSSATPHRQFVPMQRALAAKDEMMEYIEHTGSALFACPPGVAEGGYWGEQLFA